MSTRSRPSAGDRRRAFDLATRLADCDGREALHQAFRTLPDLVGAEAVIFGGELRRTPSGDLVSMLAESSDPGIYDDGIVAAGTRLWRQHPLIVRQFRGLIRQPMRISDLVGPREWRRREIYAEVYGAMGLPHEMSAHLSWSTGRVACVALHRAGRDFDERDRELLALATPHLRAAHRRVELREELTARIGLVERGLESLGGELLVVDGRGRVEAASAGAPATLRRWFRGGDAGRLPPEVDDWLASERGAGEPRPLVRARGPRTLRLRLVDSPRESLIAIEEREQRLPAPDLLAAALPLTRRQAEVLAGVVRGATTAQIASELGISPHTAGRHLEAVYTRLGVGNRAAAVAAALAAAAGGSGGTG